MKIKLSTKKEIKYLASNSLNEKQFIKFENLINNGKFNQARYFISDILELKEIISETIDNEVLTMEIQSLNRLEDIIINELEIHDAR
jgi:hypothetical protein